MNANIQGLLIAAGQNLKRLLAATGWGRRHAPCGSLLALPGPPTRLGVGLAPSLRAEPTGDDLIRVLLAIAVWQRPWPFFNTLS